MIPIEKALQQFGTGFRWRTMDGQILTLDQMKTGHIFNSMKMTFNALAKAWGGIPIWHLQHYEGYDQAAKSNPQKLAVQILFFIMEIERRGDLPEKYVEPYRAIIAQLMKKLPQADHRLLSAAEVIHD